MTLVEASVLEPQPVERPFHYLDLGVQPDRLVSLLYTQFSLDSVRDLSAKLTQKLNGSSDPVDVLTAISKYIRSKTYHISQADRLKLFGLSNIADFPHPPSMVADALSTIEKAVKFQIPHLAETWRDQVRSGYCLGCNIESFDISKSRGPELDIERQYQKFPALQCSEEATLTAALVCHMTDVKPEQIVFMGSPAHLVTFIRPSETSDGGLFDSKAFYPTANENLKLRSEGETEIRSTPADRWQFIQDRCGQLWFMTSPAGTFDIYRQTSTMSAEVSRGLIADLSNFFGFFDSTGAMPLPFTRIDPDGFYAHLEQSLQR